MNTPDNSLLDKKRCARTLETCACFNLRKTNRVVTQLFDEVLQPTGLRSTQLVILLASAVHPTASIARLARELVMDSSTLSRNLRPLEKKNLVQTNASQDGRRRIISLTDEGKQAVVKALPYWEKAQKIFVKKFGKDKWDLLVDDLSQVIVGARS